MVRRMNILMCMIMLFFSMSTINVNADEYNNVKDDVGFLSDDEESELQDEIEDINDIYQLDVVIVLTENVDGKSSVAYADDYYDYNGYGVGDDYSGLLLLVNMADREVWISTTGRAIEIYTDVRIADMVDNVTSYLSDEKYYKACDAFLQNVNAYADKGVPSNQYSEEGIVEMAGIPDTYFDRVLNLMKSPVVLIIALVIAIGATLILTFSRKGKVTINNQTYEEKGSYQLLNSRDDYLRENTIRTKIETKSGSGRSSTHTGSSGRSHGGGGGKF